MLVDTSKIFGGVAAALGIAKTVPAWWRNGPGKRRTWARAFNQLAPHVRPAYVADLFGQPAFEMQTHAQQMTFPEHDEDAWPTMVDRPLVERVWILGADGYLTTWSEETAVLAYSLTTASRRFHPKIRMGSAPDSNGAFYDVHLGRTRFSQLGAALHSNHLEGLASWKGARRHEYYETYYFGNPGHYLSWSCGASGAGYCAAAGGAMDRLGPDGSPFLRGDLVDDLSVEHRKALAEFRSHAIVNSLMVRASSLLVIEPDRPRTGPEYDVVRLVSSKASLLQRLRLRRWRRRIDRDVRRAQSELSRESIKL